ncbi:AAA family ATPase [Sulfurovum sp. bin170]|uniref:AAA family ATPase n=1 Tax=Sulfurovum sp. bin170 TaxID=2695268 RepID=UPI0013DEAFB4|nr:AAA family ATPase [Sulfurovum sp. bin170]NEW61546.1 AAA family ATPase [Sulfurovum sp. bin170]
MWQSFSKNSKIIIIALFALIAIILFSLFRDSSESINKKRAIEIIENQTIQKASVAEPYVYIYTEDNIYKVAKEAIDIEVLFDKTLVEYQDEGTDVIDILLLLVMISFTLYIISMIKENRDRQESLFEEHREEANASISQQNILPQLSRVNFSDVAGIEDVKEELEEIIDFMKNPNKYRSFDIRLPKGVLLVGPPGVGKTLIAKAVAGEADVPFFYQSASSFVQIYVGMGAKRVSELFNRAKQMAPSIIFIDELDAVGKSRGGMNNDERESTLNQLLTEMDGFEESSGVMVIAATNKIEVLDEALLRAGRFDRRVHISLPDFKERVSILKLYLKEKNSTVDIEAIAKMTIGFNSAALATLVNEAALYALRKEKTSIDTSDIEAVKEKVLLGKHKIQTFSVEEQKIQALYQSAKAVTATWLEIDYEKIGLVSSSFIPHHNEILSKTVLENELKVLLAGRMITQEVYGELFTNAKSDIHKAKLLSQQIIEEFAMSDEYFSTHAQVENLLQDASSEVKSLLSKLRVVVEDVRVYLLKNESITPIETKRILDKIF